MELDNTTPSARIQLLTQGAGLRALQPGQVLAATVVAVEKPGSITLQINGARVDARTAMSLVAGQQITVRITAAGPPPTLDIVSVNKPPQSPLTSRQIIEPSLVSVTGARHGLSATSVGQRLLAMVIDARADGQLRLQLLGHRVTARTSAVLSAGELLELRVVRGGQRPLLALLGTTAAGEVANHALRTALPRQNALPPLMAILDTLARTKPDAHNAVATKGVVELARSILDRLPDARNLSTAAGLKKALENSGVFLEQKLLRHGARITSIGNDFKADLLRLLDVLQRHGITKSMEPLAARSQTGAGRQIFPLPPLRGLEPQVQTRVAPVSGHTGASGELLSLLLNHVEATLARLQIMQLAALPTADQPEVSFTFELPLRHGERVDVVQLHIRRERADGGGEENERTWTIQLAFDLDHLGPVYVQASLRSQQITLRFWAERPAATELFAQHLAQLEDRFAAAGLSTGSMTCHTGRPPGTTAPRTSLLRDLEA